MAIGRVLACGAAALVSATIVGCGANDGGTPDAASRPASASPVPASSAPAPTTPAAAPAMVDACTLVSKTEAEALVGTPLNDALPAYQSCTYTGIPTGPTAQVEVFVGDGAKKYLDIERQLGHELSPLDNVGDEAHIEDGTVFINKGGLWVAVHLVRLDDPGTLRQRLEDLARTVAGRI